MIHSQIDLAFTAVSTAMPFVRPFRAVGCGTHLAWWWLKIRVFFPPLLFTFISPLPLMVASCSVNVLPHITPRKHFLPLLPLPSPQLPLLASITFSQCLSPLTPITVYLSVSSALINASNNTPMMFMRAGRRFMKPRPVQIFGNPIQ